MDSQGSSSQGACGLNPRGRNSWRAVSIGRNPSVEQGRESWASGEAQSDELTIVPFPISLHRWAGGRGWGKLVLRVYFTCHYPALIFVSNKFISYLSLEPVLPLMVFVEWSFPVLSSTHQPFIQFSLPVQLQRGVRVALVSARNLTSVKPLQLSQHSKAESKQLPLRNNQTLLSIYLCTSQILSGTISKLIYFGYDFPDERMQV